MRGKHFHTEWSFRVEFVKDGRIVKTCRFTTHHNEPFLTEASAREQIHNMSCYSSAYIQKHGRDGDYDAFSVYSPVPRIVTEWEDEATREEVRK